MYGNLLQGGLSFNSHSQVLKYFVFCDFHEYSVFAYLFAWR
ncbi:hypothetical protein HMPREF9446_00767 [Bacteroides fluxus YIT 12057]|uniref:Uncharacterized protein n=1 Tax=Bacteroides fluxus YIT 12057 TaxID=763034 RepID=F3PPX5_9BACE|nr:hypothetical protein HMPREF9446_00767 [Bacteroides fluxus YIT 12057]